MATRKDKKTSFSRTRRVPRRPSVLIGRKAGAKVKSQLTCPAGPGRVFAAAETASKELLRVISGDMTEEEYLELRVERALQQMKGRVSLSRLARIRELVVEQLRTDPSLLATKEQMFRQKRFRGD